MTPPPEHSPSLDAPALAVPMTVIVPPRGWVPIDFRELWQHRELFGFLVWRDIVVKYKQTLLGALWAILVPLSQALIFALMFGRVAGLESDGLPPTLFYYTSMVIWTYFATALTMSSQSMVGSARLLTKIYMPRLIIPTAPCIAALVDFAIALLILIPMLLVYRYAPPATALLIPIFLIPAFLSAVGAGCFFAALNVKYRDVRFAVPFIVQMWMFLSVIVSFSQISEKMANWGLWPHLWGLNPLVCAVEGFRWALLFPHTDPIIQPPWTLLAVGLPVSLLLFFAGITYFRRMERQFADIV